MATLYFDDTVSGDGDRSGRAGRSGRIATRVVSPVHAAIYPDAMKCGGVYAIYCKSTGKSYIGSAANFGKRLTRHEYQFRKNCHCNKYLQRAFNAYGRAAFEFQILAICGDDFEARENWWIHLVGTLDKSIGYNMSLASGRGKFSEETRFQMSEAAKLRIENESLWERKERLCRNIGRVGANKGRKMSLESREKMRQAKLGKKYGPEYGLAISKRLSMPVDQLDRSENLIKRWDSRKEAAAATGTTRSAICEVIHGTKKTAGGCVWRNPQEGGV